MIQRDHGKGKPSRRFFCQIRTAVMTRKCDLDSFEGIALLWQSVDDRIQSPLSSPVHTRTVGPVLAPSPHSYIRHPHLVLPLVPVSSPVRNTHTFNTQLKFFTTTFLVRYVH